MPKRRESSILEILGVREIQCYFNDDRRHVASVHVPENWKLKGKNSAHSLHRMASRAGSFPPSLANFFIQKFSKPGDVVLDPYCGKGTAPLEAILLGRNGIGIDAAPEAYYLTQAKLKLVTHEEFVTYLDTIDFLTSHLEAPKSVRVFYDGRTLRQILALKERLFDIERKKDVEYYLIGCMLGILHGHSRMTLSLSCSHYLSMAPQYVKRYAKEHKLKKPVRNVRDCLEKKSEMLQKDPLPKTHGMAWIGDAEKIELEDNSVDLILTSPPYLDAQTYAKDNWLRLWFLGYEYKKVRTKLIETQDEKKYRDHLAKSLSEMLRVLKSGRRAFIIVGDVRKRKKKGEEIIKTATIIAQVAENQGFVTELIIDDKVPKVQRYHSSYLKNGDGISTERIVCLRKC